MIFTVQKRIKKTVPFLVGCNPAHFENVGRPFRNIGCTTLSHDGSQGYYHQYGQILAQVFQGCCVCLVLCSALEEGMHKTYLLRVSPSSSAYYTPNYLDGNRSIRPRVDPPRITRDDPPQPQSRSAPYHPKTIHLCLLKPSQLMRHSFTENVTSITDQNQKLKISKNYHG